MVVLLQTKTREEKICTDVIKVVSLRIEKREKSGTALSIIKATAKETFETIVIPVLN